MFDPIFKDLNITYIFGVVVAVFIAVEKDVHMLTAIINLFQFGEQDGNVHAAGDDFKISVL